MSASTETERKIVLLYYQTGDRYEFEQTARDYLSKDDEEGGDLMGRKQIDIEERKEGKEKIKLDSNSMIIHFNWI